MARGICPPDYVTEFHLLWGRGTSYEALGERFRTPDGAPYSARTMRRWAEHLGLPPKQTAALAAAPMSAAPAPKEAVAALIGDAQIRQETLAAKREERKLLRQAADLQTVVDVLREEMPRLSPSPRRFLRPVLPPDPEEVDVILLISDCQIGQLVTRGFTGGLGHYDRDTFLERAHRYYTTVTRLLRMHASAERITTLHVIFAGDIIEGCGIYKSQPHALDQRGSLNLSVKQVCLGIETFSDMLTQFADQGYRIEAASIPGNHGRMGSKGDEPYMNSLDQMVAYGMRYRLEQHPSIAWTLPEQPVLIADIQGHKVIVEHGDMVNRGGDGPPAKGLQKRHRDHTMATREPVDLYLIGHHHQPAILESGFGARVVCNGSWVGTSDLSSHVMAAGGVPSQWLLGVNADHGLVWSREIYLATTNESHRLERHKMG